MIGAVVMGGGYRVFLNLPAFMITFGGTLAATLISFPLSHVLKFSTLVIRLFCEEKQSIMEQTIGRLATISHKASEESSFVLEKESREETNRYVKLGLQLLMQNASAEHIARRFAIEMDGVKSRHKEGIQLFGFMSRIAPSFGLLGTLIGLINMLRSIGNDVDPGTLGPSMAVALITTLYGCLFAFFFFLPASEKLKAYSTQELNLIRMVRDAVLIMKEGRSSRELEDMLNAYLPVKKRQSFVEKLLLAKTQKTGPKTSPAK